MDELGRLGLLVAGMALGSGCVPMHYERRPGPRKHAEIERAPVPEARPEVPVGRSVEGHELYCSVYGDGPRTVLLIGAIHGNEPGSHVLVRDFEHWLERHPGALGTDIRLVVSSPINPDGLRRATRHNANGVDLNRNFPAFNFRPSRRRGLEPLSEPEARYVADLLRRFEPALVISVHQPRRSVNYDGPARKIAAAMARHNGYRVEATVGYPTPGSLGSWVGIERKIPIITLELPRRPEGRKSFLDENLEALRAAIAMTPPAPDAQSPRPR